MSLAGPLIAAGSLAAAVGAGIAVGTSPSSGPGSVERSADSGVCFPDGVAMRGTTWMLVAASCPVSEAPPSAEPTAPVTPAPASSAVVPVVPVAGGIDSCLVGKWRSEPVTYTETNTNQTNGSVTTVSNYPGGIVVTIDEHGTMTLDYNNAQQTSYTGSTNGNETDTARGTAFARITTANHVIKLVSLDERQLHLHDSDYGQLDSGIVEPNKAIVGVTGDDWVYAGPTYLHLAGASYSCEENTFLLDTRTASGSKPEPQRYTRID